MLGKRDDREARVLSRLDELKAQVRELRNQRLELQEASVLEAEINRLKRELAELEINKSKMQEKNERDARELRHMIGLERKRQEVETAQAKREAVLSVREENLEADRERFEETIKTQSELFENQIGYLKTMVAQVLDRLPTVTVDKQVAATRSRR